MRSVRTAITIVLCAFVPVMVAARPTTQDAGRAKVVEVSIDTSPLDRLGRLYGTKLAELPYDERVLNRTYEATFGTQMSSRTIVDRRKIVDLREGYTRQRRSLRIRVQLEESKADKVGVFSECLLENLKAAFNEDWKALYEMQSKERAELKARAEELAQQMNRMQEIHREILATSGRPALDRATLVAERSKMEDERRDLRRTQLAQEARISALAENIKRISDQALTNIAKSEVVTQLEAVVALREKAVERLRALGDKGQVATDEIDSALEKLAIGRVELARARADVGRETGGDLLTKLQADLVAVSVESAETAVKLKHIESLIEDFDRRDLLNLAMRLQDDLEVRRSVYVKEIARLEEERIQAERDAIGEKPPEVRVTEVE